MPQLAAGRYAVQAFHDEAMIGHVKLNVLGLPVSGLGFSNDAPFRFGPPKWQDAAFQHELASDRLKVMVMSDQ